MVSKFPIGFHPVAVVLLDEQVGTNVVDKVIDIKTGKAYVGFEYSSWDECWRHYFDWTPCAEDVAPKSKNLLLKYPPMIKGVGSKTRSVIWWPQCSWTSEIEKLVMEYRKEEAAVAGFDEVVGINVVYV